ncbi:MAG: mmyY [Actinomycetia bacterium]|nr:mmyY [Actinomycetes bacterium]
MTDAKDLEQRLAAVVDRAEIIEVCTRMHFFLDRKAWDRYPEVFAAEISLPTRAEFAALKPGESAKGSPRPLADLTASIEVMMHELTTQHIVAGHHVDLDGDTATCYANGYNMHIGPAGIAENRVVHASYYQFGMVRTPDGWRIQSLNSNPIWAQGNEKVCGDGAAQDALLRELAEKHGGDR